MNRRTSSRIVAAIAGGALTVTALTGFTPQAQAVSVATTHTMGEGVVLINTTLPQGTAAGTGMVLTSDGLVLTNSHVVAGSTAVYVTLPSTGRRYSAVVLGRNATTDVAVLRVSGAGSLPTVTVDKDQVTTGQKVTALGNANGVQRLVAASGTITGTAATVTVANEETQSTETLNSVYQTNAAAQPGDSGGPLYDAQGEVTGMVTAGDQTLAGGTARSTVSYAIPIKDALTSAAQLVVWSSFHTNAEAKPYLGIATLPDLTVQQVVEGTAAARAGVTPGSTITSIGGTQVASRDDMVAALGTLTPGTSTQLTWRTPDGEEHSARVVLGVLN